jgi:RNA polymerase sigma factor (TIGR02999 family)
MDAGNLRLAQSEGFSVAMSHGGLYAPSAMSEVTRILSAAAAGDPKAAAELLPLVYEELRKLAAARMDDERADHSLQPTALVHEAYLRLIGGDQTANWNSRGHFFAAAAEAMRRILVEAARKRRRRRHGSERKRVELTEACSLADPPPDDDLLALDEALARLEAGQPQAAAVVKLRYFAGLTAEEAAASLGISLRTANRHWAFARAWLLDALGGP